MLIDVLKLKRFWFSSRYKESFGGNKENDGVLTQKMVRLWWKLRGSKIEGLLPF